MGLHLDGELIAIAQKLLGVLANTDASGSAGEDDGASGQSGALRAEADEFGNVEDEIAASHPLVQPPLNLVNRKHSLNTTILHDLAILKTTNMQLARIRNELGASEHRTQRTSAIKTLAVAPLALFELGSTRGNVVCGRVSEDVVQGFGFGDVFAGLGDDDCEFGFVVCCVGWLGVFGDDCVLGVGVCEGG